ncbi:MAG: hypothetical protein FWG52_02515, partial [Proteobacteria bacterium]|nr:hypothetical protein [Pseudomonadota bacterium]
KGTPKTGGRKAGTPNKATREIKAIAAPYGSKAITTLAAIMDDPNAPHAARIAASNALLDRGYGKPGEFKQISIEEPPPVEELHGEALINELRRRGLPTTIFEDEDGATIQ